MEIIHEKQRHNESLWNRWETFQLPPVILWFWNAKWYLLILSPYTNLVTSVKRKITGNHISILGNDMLRNQQTWIRFIKAKLTQPSNISISRHTHFCFRSSQYGQNKHQLYRNLNYVINYIIHRCIAHLHINNECNNYTFFIQCNTASSSELFSRWAVIAKWFRLWMALQKFLVINKKSMI